MQGYARAGLTQQGYDTLRWSTDYMLQCNLGASFGSNFAYVAQVTIKLLV